MKKHRIILDISCNKLMFWSGHCLHVRVLETEPSSHKQNHMLVPIHYQTKQNLNLTVENLEEDKIYSKRDLKRSKSAAKQIAIPKASVLYTAWNSTYQQDCSNQRFNICNISKTDSKVEANLSICTAKKEETPTIRTKFCGWITIQIPC